MGIEEKSLFQTLTFTVKKAIMNRFDGSLSSNSLTRGRTSSTSSMSSTPPQGKKEIAKKSTSSSSSSTTTTPTSSMVVVTSIPSREIQQRNSIDSFSSIDEEEEKTFQKVAKSSIRLVGDNLTSENAAEKAITFSAFVKAVANSLKSLPKNGESTTAQEFYSTMRIIPAISIENYLKRLISGINKAYRQDDEDLNSTGVRALIISLIYLNRLMYKTDLQINEYNIHRVVLIGMHLALKFLEDEQMGNVLMAKGGGLCLEEMNRLEAKYCTLLGFDFFVSLKELEAASSSLIAQC